MLIHHHYSCCHEALVKNMISVPSNFYPYYAVQGDYYAQLDSTGRRVDLDQRPELTKGSVEFVAPAEYMVRPPMPPLYFFLIDVSISAVKSGMLEVTF